MFVKMDNGTWLSGHRIDRLSGNASEIRAELADGSTEVVVRLPYNHGVEDPLLVVAMNIGDPTKTHYNPQLTFRSKG